MSSPPESYTLEHFEQVASQFILDTGNPWELEEFHIEMFKPVLSGVKATWTVIPEGNTKCLDVRSRLPTPDGWTTMLEVQLGDQVLGSDGLPTAVRRISEVKFGEDCYRVRFSDGASVVCNGEHLWAVEDAQDHYSRHVLTTRHLYERPLKLEKKGKGGGSRVARWRIPTALRASSCDFDLLVDPYVLGAWLGDGATASGRITNIDQEVWDRIAFVGYEVGNQQVTTKAYTQTVLGLQTQLRELGLLGNKHIPESYLLAAQGQRWALLQGLIDTDGCVSKAGQVTFSSVSKRLADDVRRLVWSLGLPCSLSESRSVLAGVDYGPTYLLTISCDQRHPVTTLPRKADRLKLQGRTCDHRRIVGIDRVRSVPVKCIEVDAPDRLYLTGDAYIPTHNTTSWAGFGLYHCLCIRAPWVPIIASSRDQAEIMAQQAYAIIRATPGLEWNKKTRQGFFEILEGYRIIRCYQGGRVSGRGIKVYAADVSTSDGGIPTLVLCDEGHRWPTLEPYRLWKGKLRKRNGQIAMASTAGEPGGEFEEAREKIRKEASVHEHNDCWHHYEAHGLIMNEWMIDKPEQSTDMEMVKRANPFSGITVETLADDFADPLTDLGEWKRLKCNIPSRSTRAAITETEWDSAAAIRQIPFEARIDCGVDVAWKHDTFAIQPLWRFEPDQDTEFFDDEREGMAYRLLGPPKILVPPRDGSTMHPDDVKEAFYQLYGENPIDTVVIDLERAEDIAAWLEDELQITVIDRGQGNAEAVADYDAFMKGLRSGVLRHTGDRGLRQHVMNAIARNMPGDKRRFDRPSQSRAKRKQVVRVIDALTAAAMVNRHADEEMGPAEPLVAWR